jgi:23S rRNA (pseudouridine1915-N3)-methyltransferase
MKIVALAVGKKHDSDITHAIDDYSKRLTRYATFDWQILPPAKGKMGVEETKRVEGAAIATFIKDDDYVVLLDEAGVQLSSNELAGILDDLDMQTAKRIVFIIGGAYGVTDELKRRADLLWSLSKLVFPHQLVRLLLAEQLYRANTIRRGEPYHHQ